MSDLKTKNASLAFQSRARLSHALAIGLSFAALGLCHSCLGLSGARADDQPAKKPAVLSPRAAQELFQTTIGPLLKAKCAGCHGEGDEFEGGLDLRSREAALRGGDSGAAIVLGKPTESSLYLGVAWRGDLKMPPKQRNRLTPEQVAAFGSWITAGAPWGKVEGNGEITASDDWSPTSEDTWAFQPIRRVSIPRIAVPRDVQGNQKNRHPIDAFIQDRLRRKGLAPAPRADRAELLRRAAFDLTGLPPSPGEVVAFLADTSPRAFEKLVTRMLDSPRYGEQAARRWLDVARYADTAGFSNDFLRPHAWRYRDYVIRSFNKDKPFNRFLVEQVAGDELREDDPELLIATGFLRMGPWEHTGMSVAAITRQQFLDDVTNSIGVTFLGLALRCARCHDHKFDPLPTRDYYRVQAIFAPTQFAEAKTPFLPEENTSELDAGRDRAKRLLEEANAVIASLDEKHRKAVAKFLRQRGLKNIKELPADEQPSRHFGLSHREMGLQKVYKKRQQVYTREMRRFEPYAFRVYSGPDNDYRSFRLQNKIALNGPEAEVARVAVLTGGSLAAPGEVVTPGVLSAAYASDDAQEPTAFNTIPSTMRGRRLAMAHWMASPQNPLTARVIVNRIWQQHFAVKGIVATPNNFGKMGARPTHPRLLDYLATWFIEHGWSIKKLHRLIMTSRTYQQSGRHPEREHIDGSDPANNLLAYYPARRLQAEEIADAMLAVSGELDLTMGGPSVFPEINLEVALQPRHIMGSVAPAYQPSPTPGQRNRRVIYQHRERTLRNPLLEVLNRPGSDVSCERRDSTTITPQAFALLNGRWVRARALALARRLEPLAKSPAGRIDLAFQQVYGRRPTDAQRRHCLDHVARMTEHHRTHPAPVEKLPTEVTRTMIEELTGETFQWTEELDVMKNGYQRDIQHWQVSPETRALADLCLVLLNSNEFMYVY